MAWKMWVLVGLVGSMIACGGRDRTPGTRGVGSPNGEVRDTGLGTSSPDGGQSVDAGSRDGGGVPISDGGVVPVSDGGVSDGGGTTSLDRNKPIADLNSDELGQLCGYVVEVQGTEVAECGDGKFTIEPVTYEECISTPPPSGCTVGQIQDCYDSLNGDLCNLLLTSECQALQGC